jgi:hypothetical protein
MNTTESGDGVKPRGPSQRLWFLRKPWYCLAHLLVAPAVGLQVEDATRRMVVSAKFQEERGAVDHEPRSVRRLVHRCWRHGPKSLHPPILRGIMDVQLEVKATAGTIAEVCIASLQVTTTPPPGARAGVFRWIVTMLTTLRRGAHSWCHIAA